MSATRFGIRFRISLLLLLSTLNSVVMAAAAIVTFSALVEGPSPALVAAVPAIQAQVDRVQDLVLTGDMQDAADEARLADALAGIPGLMAGVPEGLTNAQADYAVYADRVAAWQVLARRYHRGEPVSGVELEARLAEVRLAHRHLVGALQLSLVYVRPPWVQAAVPLLPWAMAWILAIGAGTVVASYGLRAQLSQPLAELARAARAVAEGDLHVQIPFTPGTTEITDLARAVRAARDRLLRALDEQERRSAREKAVFQHLGDGVAVTDPQGRVLQLNPRAEQILRLLVPSGMEPRPGLDLVRALPDLDGRSFSGTATADVEIQRTPPGLEGSRGARTWVQVAVRGVPAGAGDTGTAVVVLRDVSADRELDQLQQEFLSVVTHELKTPLTAIEGYARLLLRGKAGPLQDRQAEFVRTIADQSTVLKRMVQNLLDTSRIEGGTLPVHLQEVDVAELLAEALATWSGSAQQRDLRLELRAAPPPGTWVSADPFRLQQVLGNLIGNALKFTPPGGAVVLQGTREAASVRLDVEDSGRGIPADKLDRIFDKFFQVARGDTRVAGGAGLGLYISRRLVEAMHGSLVVRSEEGHGSCFSLWLPLAGPPSEPTG